jgi:DNA-binding winged helix-turn-helix (wHTH) protein
MSEISERALLLFGAFELDTVRRALCRDGEDVRLPPKECQVLEFLMQRAVRCLARSWGAAVWPGVTVGDASLARCVCALRRYLGWQSIQAVPKFEYGSRCWYQWRKSP